MAALSTRLVTGLLTAGALGCTFAPLAHAEIYKWVDAQGVVNYSNYPPSDMRGARVVSEGKISVVPSSRISAEEAQALTDRIAARRTTNAAVDSSVDVERVSVDDPIYYPRVVTYPYSGRSGGMNAPTVRTTPYGIGSSPLQDQRPYYREIPSR